MTTHKPGAEMDNDNFQDELDRRDDRDAPGDDPNSQGQRSGHGTADPLEEIQQLGDRVLRLQAELDNVRKRAAREMADARRFATAPLMQDLLSVVDNVQRAVAAAQAATDAKSLVDGFQLVAQQLADILGRHDCVKIQALGLPFDPHLHEAIGQQPSESEPPGTVLAVVQEGYQMHDRVLRPTRVIIAAAPPADQTSQSQ